MTHHLNVHGRLVFGVCGDFNENDASSKTYLDGLYVKAQGGDDDAVAELRDRLKCDLSFGTAGLRAPMGPGFNRINRVTVQLTSQGVAQYLSQRGAKTVVVGHDHRHHSDEFAAVVAACLRKKGMLVLGFGDKVIPTPLVSFAVRRQKADFGIMITASHNPAADNGYKVYDCNACQIMSPVDKEIAALIKSQDYQLWQIVPNLTESIIDIFSETIEAYITCLCDQISRLNIPISDAGLKIVYTPMHGVGLEVVKGIASKLGIGNLCTVPSQETPDPNFPTVKFPNPEEGLSALKEAVNFAEAQGVQIVFANDPDADRFNFAQKSDSEGPWRVFTGNEIAAILADFVWRHRALLYPGYEAFAMVNSCVSSKLLRSMGLSEGFSVIETLTGFKYIANAAQRLERESKGTTKVILAYEEAIGFMLNTEIWEKDGLSALLFMYFIMAEAGTTTMEERLVSIYQKYGYFASYNSYYFCEPASRITTIFHQIRTKLGHDGGARADLTGPCRHELGDGRQIVRIQDYPGANMITLFLDDEGLSWITLRASGTEPKIKFYSEQKCVYEVRQQAKDELMHTVQKICIWLLDPETNKLCLQNKA